MDVSTVFYIDTAFLLCGADLFVLLDVVRCYKLCTEITKFIIMRFIFIKQVIFFRSYTDRNKTSEPQKQQPIGHQPPLLKAHNNVACKYNSHTMLTNTPGGTTQI